MKIYRRPRHSAITTSRRLSAQRRAQQLRLLQEVSHQIAAALDVQEVLDRLVQSICSTLGYQLVAAALVEGDRLAFWSGATTLDVVLPPRPDFFPLDGLGLTTRSARHGETVLVGGVLADPRYLGYDLFPMTRSELTVPLVGRSGVLGIIDIQSDRLHAFDCHDVDLMQTLAEHTATAIENARLYQAEQQRRRELEELQSIALKLGGDLDLDTVLRTVVEGVASVFNADAASVLMPDPTSDTLIVRAHVHLPDLYAEILRIPCREIEEPIERYGSAGILEFPHSTGDQVIKADTSELVGFESVATCRLIVEGAFLGVLCVYSRALRRFSASECRMLGALGQQAALAISNARRYRHERLLVTDLENSYNEMLHTLTELQRAQEQLERSARLRALGELASGVAHDFNNLLAGILGNAQFMLLDENDSERRHMLNVIAQAAQDGATTVRRIQEFARQREDRTRDVVDLTAVIDGALAITRTRWHDLAQREGRPIRVRREIGRVQPALGNSAELRELLVNLIINAIDAMPQGGELTLRLDEQPGSAPFERRLARIEVIDTGIGIPPALQAQIFDSFFTTKPASQGSGLGLGICQNIANLHGGRIELSSAVGQGTTFRVLLPLDEGAAAAEVVAPRPIVVSACRVLVVDDEPSVRDVLARILRHGGHEVTTAASGEDALEHFAPGQYDLLFTDLGMPGMGGAALLRHLCARDPHLIGVVVTGWGQQDGVGDRLPEAAAVVAKPFSADRISELVGELIGARTV